ncbi:MAG TPA: cytochrome c oxidase assembly protein [Geminicoccaceae bacterium]|nr:cytochrome c oxidase assembly protein [Geminicoccaceae bacterium]
MKRAGRANTLLAAAPAAALLLLPDGGGALAHGPMPLTPDRAWSSWTSWSLAPEVVLPLLLVGWLYGRGLAALWSRAGALRGVGPWQVASFAAGWVALAVALVSPLDGMAGALASAHMVQHMILLVVAPPLLLLGNPAVPMLWALPASWRGALGRLPRRGPLALAWDGLSRPMVAAALYGAAIWIWHLPGPYQAALASPALHAFEHATLLVAGLIYWHRLIAPLRRSEFGHGGATISVVLSMIHTGLLGALLTFARRPWYPAYAPWPEAWGLTLLEDQQLAGLIMWVPMNLLYLIAALALMAHWLRLAERQPR